MIKKNIEKSTRYRKQGDKLEVKLRDSSYTPYYKKEVSTKNLKDLAILINELRDRGVPIDKAISKSVLMYQDEFW